MGAFSALVGLWFVVCGAGPNGAGVAMWSMRCAVASKVGARERSHDDPDVDSNVLEGGWSEENQEAQVSMLVSKSAPGTLPSQVRRAWRGERKSSAETKKSHVREQLVGSERNVRWVVCGSDDPWVRWVVSIVDASSQAFANHPEQDAKIARKAAALTRFRARKLAGNIRKTRR